MKPRLVKPKPLGTDRSYEVLKKKRGQIHGYNLQTRDAHTPKQTKMN